MKRTGFFGLGLGLMATLAAPVEPAEAQVSVGPIALAPMQITTVSIGCSNPGSSQDVAKTPIIKNTTATAIPKGHVIKWKTSAGDTGSVTLASDLAPSATIKVMGSAGNAYTCSASFNSKPDLYVKKAAWSAAEVVTVDIANTDPWLAAAQNTIKLEVVACSGAVLQTVNMGVRSVPQNGTASVNFTAKKPNTKHYFRVKADSGLVIPEKNENNNLWDAYNSCVY